MTTKPVALVTLNIPAVVHTKAVTVSNYFSVHARGCSLVKGLQFVFAVNIAEMETLFTVSLCKAPVLHLQVRLKKT